MLRRSGGGWLSDAVRRRLVRAVEGHALAVGALAGALEGRPPGGDVGALADELEQAARTDERVGRVLAFYAERLDERDRALAAIVSLFQRPVPAQTVLTLGGDLLDGVLRSWAAADVRAAVQQRLGGLLSWHGDGTVSAHPLVRDTFRPLALTPDSAKLASDLQLADLPEGTVTTRRAGPAPRRDRRAAARRRSMEGRGRALPRARLGLDVWMWLPAVGLGARCSLAFVSTPARERACRDELSEGRLGFFINAVGLFSMNSGDLTTAVRFLRAAVDDGRDTGDPNLPIRLGNQSECLAWMGQVGSKSRRGRRGARDRASRWCGPGGMLRLALRTSHWELRLGGDTSRCRGALRRRRQDRVRLGRAAPSVSRRGVVGAPAVRHRPHRGRTPSRGRRPQGQLGRRLERERRALGAGARALRPRRRSHRRRRAAPAPGRGDVP